MKSIILIDDETGRTLTQLEYSNMGLDAAKWLKKGYEKEHKKTCSIMEAIDAIEFLKLFHKDNWDKTKKAMF